MDYKASLGTTSKVITLVVTLLLGAIIGYAFWRAIAASHTATTIIAIVVSVLISALYVLSYLFRPTKYLIDEKGLTVKRPIGNVSIRFDEIKDAFIVRRESMRSRERVGGSDGLFGFYGQFRGDFGVMTWYATRLNNYVMIETIDNRRIVITPDDMDLVKEIRRGLKLKV